VHAARARRELSPRPAALDFGLAKKAMKLMKSLLLHLLDLLSFSSAKILNKCY
jgi:hypothetical protein